MTGNWITANLQAAMDFFNAMMTFLYDILDIFFPNNTCKENFKYAILYLVHL